MNSNDNYCPVEESIRILNKKYLVNILYCLYTGKTRFKDFLENDKRLDNKSLSRCLNFMLDEEIIGKIKKEDEVEYYLTEKGEKLDKILFEIAEYTIEKTDNEELIRKLNEVKSNF